MIVHKCIEFRLKSYTKWIIEMRLKVLSIIHYLIRRILVEIILDVHVRGVKIKSSSI
jgi:hypothetical protein